MKNCVRPCRLAGGPTVKRKKSRWVFCGCHGGLVKMMTRPANVDYVGYLVYLIPPTVAQLNLRRSQGSGSSLLGYRPYEPTRPSHKTRQKVTSNNGESWPALGRGARPTPIQTCTLGIDNNPKRYWSGTPTYKQHLNSSYL